MGALAGVAGEVPPALGGYFWLGGHGGWLPDFGCGEGGALADGYETAEVHIEARVAQAAAEEGGDIIGPDEEA